eukprot:GILI01015779.1.p1 GENE.GILI01015779.1~~GILI01015779.1.p1  ORF type:complete len:424 (+),score=90.44 GILI01015779.1:115-1272(+)
MSAISAPSFSQLNDLASEKFGARVLFATDEFFAPAPMMLQEHPAQWIADKYTTFGKWMDGWETRRKRIAGHDWCILRLGLSGVIRGFDVDTSHFTGNFVPAVSIQAACLDFEPQLSMVVGDMGTACTPEQQAEAEEKFKSGEWEELLPVTPLRPGYAETAHNFFAAVNPQGKRFTHVRLNLYPDGGIARFRVYGDVAKDWSQVGPQEALDLVAVENGGVGLTCSDAHYGAPRNLIKPGRGVSMADGWETARHRHRPAILKADAQNNLNYETDDWAMIRMGHEGYVQRVVVDTHHFKGNFPESFLLEGCRIDSTSSSSSEDEESALKTANWQVIIERSKLGPHAEHFFDQSHVKARGPFTHVRLTMYPDGGISRLRVFGTTGAPSN